ncbi:MAG TPA: transglutaminase-like domain-containing protein [Desulfobacterales bacterium]|nr:transglutaminase-like domain-containing protein [Desulfobacterales bacterium]
MTGFRVAGIAAAVVFAVLLGIRLDVWESFTARPRSLPTDAGERARPRESWMSIFQNNRKIGFAHSRLQPTETGYELEEKVAMRINTMGMIQDLRLQTRSRLNRNLALERFEFGIASGRFRFSAQGEASGGVLSVRTEAAGEKRSIEVPVQEGVTPAAAVIDALALADLKPGSRYTFDVFDPAALAQMPVLVEVIGPEEVTVTGQRLPATKVTLNFRGMIQTAWIGENGDLLRERGLLGMRLEKTSRADALDDLGLAASQDLTELAAITPDRPIGSPETLEVLRVAIGGAPTTGLQLQGGRQRVSGGVLTVRKESLAELPDVLTEENLPTLERVYLKPEPFIQSDHAKIRAQVRAILGDPSHMPPLLKAQRLMDWIRDNIERRPVLSLPDAVATLEHRMGDCNEHAVLFAALARAAGIPARVEAGVVYLRGRFYYHAWNLLYLGRWITADALFDQLPADVTHLRFATGSMQQPLDLVGLVGRLTITIQE